MEIHSIPENNPTFDSMIIGEWKWRLAVAADVSAGAARTVGDLIKEHDNDGVIDVDEAATP